MALVSLEQTGGEWPRMPQPRLLPATPSRHLFTLRLLTGVPLAVLLPTPTKVS